jgi:hypothetical protein
MEDYMMPRRKLTIELVPEPLWGKSLANNLPRREWERIRAVVLARQSSGGMYVCGVCGKEKNNGLQCHEIWKYDDERHIQKLAGFVAICGTCHMIKHYGRTRAIAKKGGIDIDKVNQHYMDVNGCFLCDLRDDYHNAMVLWKERSSWTDWTQDIGDYKQFL